MKILGIDPGTSLIGYGIIEKKNNNLTCLKQGTFITEKNIPNKERVLRVFNFFTDLIKKEEIDMAAIEKLFFFKNAKTVMEVSEMRGVLILALVKNGINIEEYTPLQIKQSVSTYGRATKEQVQNMVKMILSLTETPKPDDIADALAVAICCANTSGFK